MSQAGWWQAQLEKDLSQGDIVSDLPLGLLDHPPVYLKHVNIRGGADGWAASDGPSKGKDSQIRALAAAKVMPAVVLSHSCEIDKAKGRLLVAPVARLDTLTPEQQGAVMQLRSFAQMPLPEVPGVGDCYADLRSIVAVRAEAVRTAPRLASMSEAARVTLHARLIAFLTRLDPSAIG